MVNADTLAKRLEARFGIVLLSEVSAFDREISLRVEGVAPPNGFRIALSSGWRSVVGSFVPDPFASGLLKTICGSQRDRRGQFASLVGSFSTTGITSSVRIDGRTIDATALPDGEWTKFELSCTRLTHKSDEQRDAEEVMGACLALLLSLLPVVDTEVGMELSTQGLPEGAIMQVTVNRYERSPVNRAAAIALHGVRCHACDFDFSEFYGDLGEGFIEIHHRTPVSRIGPDYVVVPSTDLVPLCANCHRMVHREDPPIPVEEIRSQVARRRADPPGGSK